LYSPNSPQGPSPFMVHSESPRPDPRSFMRPTQTSLQCTRYSSSSWILSQNPLSGRRSFLVQSQIFLPDPGCGGLRSENPLPIASCSFMVHAPYPSQILSPLGEWTDPLTDPSALQLHSQDLLQHPSSFRVHSQLPSGTFSE
jgi:hypothetical protein